MFFRRKKEPNMYLPFEFFCLGIALSLWSLKLLSLSGCSEWLEVVFLTDSLEQQLGAAADRNPQNASPPLRPVVWTRAPSLSARARAQVLPPNWRGIPVTKPRADIELHQSKKMEKITFTVWNYGIWQIKTNVRILHCKSEYKSELCHDEEEQEDPLLEPEMTVRRHNFAFQIRALHWVRTAAVVKVVFCIKSADMCLTDIIGILDMSVFLT